MTSKLDTHFEQLKNSEKITSEELREIIEKFKFFDASGVHSNALVYILNLNSLKYEYMSKMCTTFTGRDTEEFYNKGMDILPEIIVKDDFESMSKTLFPEMNKLSTGLSTKEKAAVVFEFHYRMMHKETNVLTTVVEYSSYTCFDKKGNATLSTGICYESILDFNGVRGIVRLKRDDIQITLYDKTLDHSHTQITKSEKEIIEFLKEGLSRKEIALKRHISKYTVDTHVKNIYRKLGINKVSEL